MTLKTNNTKTLTVIGLFALFTVAMTTGPLAQTMSDNTAYAKSKPTGGNDEAEQGISERQSSEQNAQCVAGGSIALSCNNQGAQGQSNEGDSSLGQKGGDGDSSADQSGEQGQSSEQNAQCVAGGSIALSCNNQGAQGQSNEGDSSLGQKGGDGDSSADQSGEQGQSSEQNAQCVSGEETIVSCNNAEFQEQVNSGNRVLGRD